MVREGKSKGRQGSCVEGEWKGNVKLWLGGGWILQDLGIKVKLKEKGWEHEGNKGKGTMINVEKACQRLSNR